MNRLHHRLWLLAAMASLVGCHGAISNPDEQLPTGQAEPIAAEPAKGPHGGRLLSEGSFTLELAVFETGVPPEFRAWVTEEGVPVAPGDVDLHVTLTRLGGGRDEIGFAPREDFLRGDTLVYEPHSFIVAARRADVSLGIRQFRRPHAHRGRNRRGIRACHGTRRSRDDPGNGDRVRPGRAQ